MLFSISYYYYRVGPIWGKESTAPHHNFYESEVFTPGKVLSQISTPWKKMGILICYDNRFLEATRLVCKEANFLIEPSSFNRKIAPL